MAGTLVIDTLKASTGVLATQNGMTGIAKAWVYFQAGSSPTISGSFNVSSVTYNTTGSYTVTFTTAMPSVNYSAVFGGARDATPSNATGICAFYAPSVGSIQFLTGDSNFTPTNYTRCNVTIFSA